MAKWDIGGAIFFIFLPSAHWATRKVDEKTIKIGTHTFFIKVKPVVVNYNH